MKITQAEFDREVARMVESPAWEELAGWFTEKLVRRVIASGNGAHAHEASAHAARDMAGAQALILAVSNHVQTTMMGVMHDNRSKGRAAAAAEAERQGGRATRNAKRAGGARKQAGTEAESGGTG